MPSVAIVDPVLPVIMLLDSAIAPKGGLELLAILLARKDFMDQTAFICANVMATYRVIVLTELAIVLQAKLGHFVAKIVQVVILAPTAKKYVIAKTMQPVIAVQETALAVMDLWVLDVKKFAFWVRMVQIAQ